VAAARRCSECQSSLAGMQPTAKTCCESCRKKRARRLAKKKTRKVPEHMAGMHDAVTKATDDAVQEAVRAELAPIVREAITDDVLQSVDKLMRNIVPAALEAMADDIHGEDRDLRQRAYTLALKYTLGNPSVAPKPDAPSGQPIQISFEVPRPGTDTPAIEAAAEELKACQECGMDRPVSEFLEASDRCVHCDAALRARVAERFGS
jgi:hypothetical protein